LINRFSALLCASENIFNKLSGRIPEPRLHLIPVPFEPPPKTRYTTLRPKKDAETTLLFAGSLTEGKGVPELIKSCIRLQELGHSIRLLLVGTNRLGERFIAGLPDFITYFGPLPQGELWRLMQEVDVIILPSKSEGMPRVCLEGFSFGKRVLCPPGVPEFARECPETVIPSIDTDTILNKILECLQWENIRAYPLERHYVGKCVTQTKSVYERLIPK
jgi:glycosyltransferase involved in cell wall biosynthesis